MKPLVCKRCKKPGVRNEKHDVYACAECDVWLEEICEDPYCEFCSGRPDKPSEAPKEPESDL